MRFVLLIVAISGGSGFCPASENVTLRCRVVDSDGTAVPGARIQLRRMPGTNGEAEDIGHSDSDGRFESEGLPVGTSYTLEILAKNHVPAFSDRTHKTSAGVVELPPIVLRRLRTIGGRVEDHLGTGVGDVVVFQRGDGATASTKTNADGQFELQQVPESSSLIFADRKGFWFTGRLVKDDGEMTIRLTPRTMPNPQRFDLDTRPESPKLLTQYLRNGIRDLEKRIRDAVANNERFPGYKLDAIAWSDIEAARRLAEEIQLDASMPWRIEAAYAEVRALHDVTEALTILAKVPEPETRLNSYLRILDSIKENQKLPVLIAAEPELRVLPARLRMNRVASFYGHAAAIGEKELCGRLHAMLLSERDRVRGDGQLTGQLAEAIANSDPDEAIRLLKGTDPQYNAWVAYRIAATRPQKAAKLLRDYPFDENMGRAGRWHVLPRACVRMAPVNLPLAKELAQIMDTAKEMRAYTGLGDPATTASWESPAALVKGLIYGLMADKNASLIRRPLANCWTRRSSWFSRQSAVFEPGSLFSHVRWP